MNVVKLRNPVHVAGDPSIIVEVVTITPEVASQWLKCNKNNRPVRRRHVEFLASEILKDHWQVNGQAIVISDDEQVLDGQHRLMAIIEAGVAVKSLVVYGISPDAFKTMDTGAVRTGSDAIALFYPDATHQVIKAIGAAVPWCLRLETGFYGRTTKISNTQVLEYVQRSPSLWRCAEFLAGLPKDARPLSLGCGTALYEIFQRKNEALAEQFMRAFYTGELISINDPEYVLRQMLIKDAQRLTSYPAEIKMKMSVKAWNWRRRGRGDAPRQMIAIHPKDPDRITVL